MMSCLRVPSSSVIFFDSVLSPRQAFEFLDGFLVFVDCNNCFRVSVSDSIWSFKLLSSRSYTTLRMKVLSRSAIISSRSDSDNTLVKSVKRSTVFSSTAKGMDFFD